MSQSPGVLLLAIVVAAAAAPAAAQAFKTDIPTENGVEKPKVTDAEARAQLQTVKQALENAAEFQKPESKGLVENYLKDYLFPAMTRTSAEGLTKLAPHRKQLLGFLQPPIHEQAFQLLTTITFDEMKRIATDNYHPHARYNAVLIIGSLNQAPAAGQQDPNAAPAPLPAATDFLIQMLQADPGVAPDVVKLAAVVSLERHVAAALPDDKKKALADELVKLITSKRPDYRTQDVHAWLQFRAVEIVTQLGGLGENNSVHNGLVAFMMDDTVPLTDRMYAAKSLERLKPAYTPQAGIDPQATVAALGNVLADVMEDEKKEAFKFNTEQISGVGYQGLELLFGDGKPPGYAKGRFLQRINYVLDGFAAVDGALPEDVKKEVQAVLAQVSQLREVALDRREDDVALPRQIESTADQIVVAAEGLGEAPAAAAAATDDEGLGAFGAQNP
jgi:hypothetical protein